MFPSIPLTTVSTCAHRPSMPRAALRRFGKATMQDQFRSQVRRKLGKLSRPTSRDRDEIEAMIAQKVAKPSAGAGSARDPVRSSDPRPAPAIAAGAPGAVMEEPQHARRVEAEADPLLRTGDQLG